MKKDVKVKKKVRKVGALVKIRTAMKKVEEQGLSIVANSWGCAYDAKKGYFVADPDEKGRVCALGALLIYTNGKLKYKPTQGRNFDKEDVSQMAAYVLGVDEFWVSGFISGFDGDVLQVPDLLDTVRKREYAASHDMGRKLRAEFLG